MADTTKEPSRLQKAMDAPLQATGAEVPPGSYGGTLFGFSEPFELDATKSKFYKAGDPPKKTVFEARFGVYDKNGVATGLDMLLPFIEGGATNRRSNVYKVLKNLAVGTNLMDDKGGFSKDVRLSSFVGLSAVLAVKKNDKDFPVVESISPKMDGVKYPTLAECQLITASQDDTLPF